MASVEVLKTGERVMGGVCGELGERNLRIRGEDQPLIPADRESRDGVGGKCHALRLGITS